MFTIDTFNLGSPLGEKSGLAPPRASGSPPARTRAAARTRCPASRAPTTRSSLYRCAIAAPPPERTYLALGHRLLAEIAMADRQWDQTEAEVAHALAAIMDAQAPITEWHAYAIAPPEGSSPSAGSVVPLAAWRVHATAAKLSERQGRPSEAEARQRSGAVIQQLADSLDASDPLRESLAAM